MRILGLLCLTHSSRRTNLERCSPQFLERRFGDADRLRRPPPAASLPPATHLYSGGLSLYRVVEDGGRVRVLPLGALRSRVRIQHAAFVDAHHLLVGCEHHLESWRLRRSAALVTRLAAARPELAGRCEDPHLAGLHTVAPLPGGGAVLSCSAADALLVVDDAAAAVVRRLPLPATVYPRAYPLTPELDLRRHYVPDRLQAAHVNAAFPDASGRWIAVSTLIQGAIGVYDLQRERYEEVTRGFVGCHGARFDDAGRLYFADSTAGALIVLDDGGRIAHRFAVGSRWLHDVQQIAGGIYAFALADRNELRVVDVDRDQVLYRRRFATWPAEVGFALARAWPRWLGNSVQALSYHRLTPPSPLGDLPGLLHHRAGKRPATIEETGAQAGSQGASAP